MTTPTKTQNLQIMKFLLQILQFLYCFYMLSFILPLFYPSSKINDFAIGTVLWKQGHVGVYIGNGECVEAKGINYGTIKSNVKDTKWKYGLTFDDMSYSYEKTIAGTSKQKNPYVKPVVTLRGGNSSECVKWLQFP